MRLFMALMLALAPALPSSQPLIKGGFKLSDARSGRAVSDADFHGKIQLVFFGFTHCPLTCPIGLQRMAEALKLLGPQSSKVAPIFITIDPERDDARTMREYAAAFNPAIVPLLGSREATHLAMRSFRLEAQRTEVKSGSEYQMDHPALFYVMDAKGKYLQTLASGADPRDLAAALKKIISK